MGVTAEAMDNPLPRLRSREALCAAILMALMLASLTLLVSNVCSVTSGATGHRIGVLMSQDAPPYQQALAGFRQYLAQQQVESSVEIYTFSDDASQAKETIAALRKNSVALLLTLGAFAMREAVRVLVEIPIVAGLVLDAQDLRQATNATGVILEFPLETEFQWLQRLLPEHKTIQTWPQLPGSSSLLILMAKSFSRRPAR